MTNLDDIHRLVSSAEAEIDACGRRQTAMRRLAKHYARLAEHAETVAGKARLLDNRVMAVERARIYRNVAKRIMEVAK